MATTTKIWDGTTWRDLEGPQGPAGPTVVSADAGNASRLGTDGKLYTPTVTPPTASTVAGAADSAAGAQGVTLDYARADHSHPYPTAAQVGAITQAQADARYVEVTGDTMTGQLIVKPLVGPASPDGSVQVVGESTRANFSASYHSDALNSCGVYWIKRSRGSSTAPTAVQNNDLIGQIGFRGHTGSSYVNAALWYVVSDRTPVAGADGEGSGWATSVISSAFTGVKWANATHTLEVGGDTMLRGPLDVVGNITSAGTAHAFAANSIPSSAISGLPIRTQVITQTAYNALATKDPLTLYLISGV